MITVENRICKALRTHAESLLLPGEPPFLWPGESNLLPDASGALRDYVRVGDVTNAPSRLLLKGGKPNQRGGALMLTYVCPVTRYTTEQCKEMAGKIAAHFVDGTRVKYQGVCVEITDYPHVQDGYEDAGFWTIPVRIPWRCFA